MSQPTISPEQQAAIIQSLNPQSIINQNKEKLENAQLINIVNDRTQREPLPATTSELFDGDDFTVETSNGGVKIRKIKAMDYTIWKMTDSPFYKMIMGDIDTSDGDKVVKTMIFNEEALYELVYQFTHPIRDVYKLVKENREKYHEVAVEEVGFIYNISDLMLIADGIAKYSNVANQGRVELQAPQSEDKKKPQP